MAQIHKLEIQTKLNSSPYRFFDIYKNKTYLLPKISPQKLQSIKVVEGDGKSVGSVRLWTYVLDGPVIAKDKIDAVDEENRIITFDLIGGEVTKYFKSFKATLQTMAVADKNLVKWTLEYEKANEDVPTPYSYLDFLRNVAEEVDSYLLKPQKQIQ